MSRKCYRLLPSEREYLEKGSARGSYRPHELEERIEMKVDLLPDRFETLFDDVEQLRTGYFEPDPPEETDVETGEPVPGEHYSPLDTERGLNAWLELMELGEWGERGEGPTKQEVVEEFSHSDGRPGSAPAKFGAKFGKMVNRLMRWLQFEGIEEKDVIADLVWGFLRGLHFDLQVAGDVTEEVVREDTADIFERLERRADSYADSCSHNGLNKWALRQGLRRAQTRNMAAHVDDILGQDVSPQNERPVNTDLTIYHDSSDDDPGPFCYDVVYHLINARVPEDTTFASKGQMDAFWDEHGPPETFNVEEFVTEKRVRSIINERRLIERDKLLTHLKNDAEGMAAKTRLGVSAADVLPVIIEEGPISSEEVAKDDRVRGSRKYTASVTRLAKDLAGQGPEPEHDDIMWWVERPILQGDRDGWEATRYGEAINHTIPVVAQEGEWAIAEMATVFSESLIENALNEVIPPSDNS